MLLSRARYLGDSGFLGHIPFAFWLVEALRPDVLVELGLEDGVSYLALCQAMERLQIGGRCFGIDLRPSGDSLPAAFVEHERLEYADVSSLLVGDAAAERFEDRSIDLLHVPRAIDQSVADSLFSVWRRTLSDRAVLLLHGVDDRKVEGAAGAWLDGMLAGSPSITVDGLTAVLAGRKRNPLFAGLAALKPGSPAHVGMHRLFARLGEAHRLEWQVRSQAVAALRSREALDEAEARCKALEAGRDAAAEESSRQRAALRSELEDRRAEDRARSAEIQSLRQIITAQEGEASRLRAQLESRFREIFLLTERLESGRGEKTVLQAQLDAAAVEAAGLRSLIEASRLELDHLRHLQIGHLGAIEHAEAERQAFEQRYREIAKSPWWKATKPLRQLTRAFRRR